MVDTLVARLSPSALHLNWPYSRCVGKKWLVISTGGESQRFDAVIWRRLRTQPQRFCKMPAMS